MAPTPEQNHSYGECVRLEREAFMERRAGRSGLRSDSDDALYEAHHGVIEAAMNAGVVFDRSAFQ